MLELSDRDGLRMKPERTDIWGNTDDTRCGLVVRDTAGYASSGELLREFVRFTLGAADFESGLPWGELPGTSFEDFLHRMTTVFTDTRLNMKGLTWELRTPDSLPLDDFRTIWDEFVTGTETGMRDWQAGYRGA